MAARLAVVVLVVGLVTSASAVARADEIGEATVYAASKRPLDDVKRNIAGVGLEWIDAPAPTRSGWTLRFGAAIEHEADCAWTKPTCPFPSGSGPEVNDHVEAGAHARIGWMWRLVQIEGGVLAYGTSTVRPDVVARFGTRTMFLAVGHGTYAAPTMLAPLIFVQGELGFAERWTTTLTAGASPYDRLRHDRFDFAMHYRLTRNLRIGEGLALAHARAVLGGEARLEVAWSF